MRELYFALVNQGFDGGEAKEIIAEMKKIVENGGDPEEILYEYGLEPDYVFCLI